MWKVVRIVLLNGFLTMATVLRRTELHFPLCGLLAPFTFTSDSEPKTTDTFKVVQPPSFPDIPINKAWRSIVSLVSMLRVYLLYLC